MTHAKATTTTTRTSNRPRNIVRDVLALLNESSGNQSLIFLELLQIEKISDAVCREYAKRLALSRQNSSTWKYKRHTSNYWPIKLLLHMTRLAEEALDKGSHAHTHASDWCLCACNKGYTIKHLCHLTLTATSASSTLNGPQGFSPKSHSLMCMDPNYKHEESRTGEYLAKYQGRVKDLRP